MANRQWLDEVKRQLVENGLPPAYIRRFMEELADHIEDLMEETMNQESEKSPLSQLGEPSHIADAAIVAYRQRTFFGRHPIAKFWLFGFSPIFTMILGFVAACFVVGGVGMIYEACGIRLTDKAYFGGMNPSVIRWGLSIITTIWPAVMLTVLYVYFARRSNLRKRWIVTSCIMVSLIAMMPITTVTFSDIPGKNQFTVGLSLPPTTWQQCVQMIVPLAIGLLLMRRTRTEPTDKEEPLRAAA